MASHRVTDQPGDLEPGPAALIEHYLSSVTAGLPGPRRARTAAINELRDGLRDAVDAHRRRGLDARRATEAAIVESGAPALVAAAYQPVLADLQARHTGQLLIATGPVVGALWLLTLVPRHGPDALLGTVPVLGGVVAVGALAALLTLAATGRTAGRLPDVPRLPQLAATLACAAATVVDLAMLTTAATRIVTTPSAVPWVLALAAAAASVARLVYSQHAVRTHRRQHSPAT